MKSIAGLIRDAVPVCLALSALGFVGISRGESDSGNLGFLPPFDGLDALGTLEVMEGFRVELFAAEPLVEDPAAMEVDEYGRIYVVEMRGYPLNASGMGRVKLLEDTTGDGYPDSYSIFADGLSFPKGLMRWKQGILVTDAPHLYYLEDTTGDGKADLKEIMLTGFARSNPQHNFNSPVFGLDNWIYLANNGAIWTETYADLFGDRGSDVRFYHSDEAPRLPQNAGGRNVRFKPDTHQIEMRSTWSQFGHTFDAWGRHFLVSNAHHQYYEAIERKYLERNPSLPLRSPIHSTSTYGNAAEVYPITVGPEHQLLTDRGVFTSASGLTWYLGGAFPEEFNNVTFVAESVHNLVHAAVVEGDGAVFAADRLLEGREFLASRDPWFRPVHFYIGPDGALYVIDYYRRIVEHPQWMDDEVVESVDLYELSERGRIYRIVPEEMGNAEWTGNLSLGDASVEELVEYLEDRNIWWRRTAQRLIVDRRDPSAVGALRAMTLNGRAAASRVHALWTLEGLGEMDAELLETSLRDERPEVRENAIRLSERWIGQSPQLEATLLNMGGDPDPKVRYQLSLTLGDLPGERVDAVRRQILFENVEDAWVQIAYLSGKDIDFGKVFGEALERLTDTETPGRTLFFRRIASSVSRTENRAHIQQLLKEGLTDLDAGNEWWKAGILSGLGETLPYSGIAQTEFRDESKLALTAFFDPRLEAVRSSVMALLTALGVPREDEERTLRKALDVAHNRGEQAGFRADAIRLISLIGPEPFKEELLTYIRPAEPSVVQQEALAALGRIPGIAVAAVLLENWNAMTPAMRDRAVDAMMREEGRIEMLLDAVEDKRVLISTIGWPRRVRLMRDTSGGLRERARRLLNEDPEQRDEVLGRYRNALTLDGEALRGRDVFRRSCMNCHQVREEEGIAFGPDILTVRHWSPEALLSKILDPNRSIADGYQMWIIEQVNGQSVAGVIVEESTNILTIRNAGGIETRLPRSEIGSITALNGSAMPSGFEEQITEEEMADLIAYIRQL